MKMEKYLKLQKKWSFFTKNQKNMITADVAMATVEVIQRSNQKFWNFCWKQFFCGHLWKFQGFWSSTSGFRVIYRGPSRGRYKYKLPGYILIFYQLKISTKFRNLRQQPPPTPRAFLPIARVICWSDPPISTTFFLAKPPTHPPIW